MNWTKGLSSKNEEIRNRITTQADEEKTEDVRPTKKETRINWVNMLEEFKDSEEQQGPLFAYRRKMAINAAWGDTVRQRCLSASSGRI
ncbi:MAG: hypothetical protein ACUZ77_01185 [Candidatus Brocadiales bacterium]